MKVLHVISFVLATIVLKVCASNQIVLVPSDSDRLNNFIVNGAKAHNLQFPWQIYITASSKRKSEPTIVCGGVLITSKNALTAAHCCIGYDKFDLLMGKTVVNKKDVTRTTHHCKSHKGYVTSTYENDIAVLRFRKIVIKKSIQPIALPSRSARSNCFVNSVAIASGWGRQSNGHLSTDLKYISVHVIPNKECRPYFAKHVFKTTLCVKSSQKKSICLGDSGGPLVVYSKKQPILIGITSFVAGGCTKGLPMGFTRVTEYLDWIRKHK